MIQENYNQEALKWVRNEPITLGDFICGQLISQKIETKNGVLLDAGCGEGFWTRQLKNKFEKVIGVDFSAKMIQLAQEQDSEIEYHCADIRQLTFLKKETADVILSLSVLHYLKDAQEIELVLKKFFRILKKNGRLFFSVIHPCFNTKPGKVTENYFENELYHGEMIGCDSRRLSLSCYQHKISDYLNGLVTSGFKLKEVLEPQVSKELLNSSPDFFNRNRNVPQFLIISAEK